jgi:hypothetical protein
MADEAVDPGGQSGRLIVGSPALCPTPGDATLSWCRSPGQERFLTPGHAGQRGRSGQRCEALSEMSQTPPFSRGRTNADRRRRPPHSRLGGSRR